MNGAFLFGVFEGNFLGREKKIICIKCCKLARPRSGALCGVGVCEVKMERLVFGMTRNVLSELDILLTEVIDNGVRQTPDGEVPYRARTRFVLQEVVNYVRGATWTTNDTDVFVAQNFLMGQTALPNAWAARFPDKGGRAPSSIRVCWGRINHYLEAVFPADMVDVFVTENDEKLNELLGIVEALRVNDSRIEAELGAPLVSLLESVKMPDRRYSADECAVELSVLRRLSASEYQRELDKCDKKKLGYVYYMLTRPSVVKGGVNAARLEFVKRFVNSASSGVSSAGVVSSGTAFDGLACASVLDRFADEHSVSEEAFINPQVLYALHDYFLESEMMKRLSKFDAGDVAYALRELRNGNEAFWKAVRDGNPDKGAELLDGVSESVEAAIEGAGVSEKVSPVAVQVLSDYMSDVMKRRLASLKPDELARVYADMFEEGTQAWQLAQKFTSEETIALEQQRLYVKSKKYNEG